MRRHQPEADTISGQNGRLQRCFIFRQPQSARTGEPPGGSLLVIIAMLAQLGPSRHQDKRLAMLGRRDDHSHPGMRHDQFGCGNMGVEVRRREKGPGPHRLRHKTGIRRLRHHVEPMARGNRIQRTHQAQKRQLCASHRKDHSTLPA